VHKFGHGEFSISRFVWQDRSRAKGYTYTDATRKHLAFIRKMIANGETVGEEYRLIDDNSSTATNYSLHSVLTNTTGVSNSSDDLQAQYTVRRS
jgi:hypothetical protein